MGLGKGLGNGLVAFALRLAHSLYASSLQMCCLTLFSDGTRLLSLPHACAEIVVSVGMAVPPQLMAITKRLGS